MADSSAAPSRVPVTTTSAIGRPKIYVVPNPVAQAPAGGWYVTWGKRVLDVTVAGIMLVLLAPILAVSWLGLRLSLGPNVVLHQRRVGLGGRDFEMLKFRTMLPDKRSRADSFDGQDRRRTHKSDNDPRHTRVGRVMRRLSIDELPQLVNVLRGDMSIVGPRPELSQVADAHGLREHPRHQLRPGLTGVWQTTLRGTGALLHETVDTDLDYLDEISLRRDFTLIARTAKVFSAGR